MEKLMEFRNVAIIAHVDHGKTTLVDALLKQSWTFRENQEVGTRLMDSNDQEKERGITIYSKNTAVFYKDTKINIIDTPWHADFSSEVERVLRMVDSVILVVDAYEGPMPQTKFVLKKSLELGLKPLVVINKIDKPAARPDWVVDELFDLMESLWANDEQLDFPVVYAIARDGIAKLNLDEDSKDITPLFEAILKYVPSAPSDTNKPFRMQVANLDYDNFLGRMWVWRVYEGKVKVWQQIVIIDNKWNKRKWKVSAILTTEWLQKKKVDEAVAWDVVQIAWIDDIFVWETICENEDQEALPPIQIDEPTYKMKFLVNNSPFAGREWKYVTSRQIRERLERELETNVWLKINFWADEFEVAWRWELHLSVLIESMRREGFELQVGAPEVIMKEENWQKLEPFEEVTIFTPSEFAGSIIEKLWKRKWQMLEMNEENGQTNLKFKIPSRGLIGFKWDFTTMTKGEGILSSIFIGYEPYAGDIEKREVWSMISGENGKAMTYSLWNLQERWPIFIKPWTEVYEGMVIGEHLKWWDLVVNPCKNKKLTNMRAAGSDEAMRLTPPREMNLEQCIDYIWNDEYVEITPKNVRIRKIHLKESDRKKAKKNK
jgi:GTP-binding protein